MISDWPFIKSEPPPPPRLGGFKIGVLVRATSLWVGAHWSAGNKRLCINLVPFVTLYIVCPGGVAPRPKCTCQLSRNPQCRAHGG